jgi:hypothetical protein
MSDDQQIDRTTRRMVDVVIAFNKGERALAELIGPEKARRYFEEQRLVASKVHREPPESIRHMRF